MKNLFKYAAEHWKTLIAIIIVLFIQAYCDLSLPAYTSDIVNVGIQQGGVEEQVPEAISADEMSRLLLFVPSEDQDTVLDAYEEDDSTYDVEAYVMKEDISEEDIGTLEEILAYPMMMTAGFESGSDMTAQIEEQLKASLPEEAATGRHDRVRYPADDAGGTERSDAGRHGRTDGLICRIRFWIRRQSAMSERPMKTSEWIWMISRSTTS